MNIIRVAIHFTCKWVLVFIAGWWEGLFLNGLRLAVSTVTPGHHFPRGWNGSGAVNIKEKKGYQQKCVRWNIYDYDLHSVNVLTIPRGDLTEPYHCFILVKGLGFLKNSQKWCKNIFDAQTENILKLAKRKVNFSPAGKMNFDFFKFALHQTKACSACAGKERGVRITTCNLYCYLKDKKKTWHWFECALGEKSYYKLLTQSLHLSACQSVHSPHYQKAPERAGWTGQGWEQLLPE